MGALEIVAILAAGMAAGAINAVVGSGTLITFPVLLAFGYSPVVANVSNTIGLVPGSVSGAVGYRRELEGQRARLARVAPWSLAGGVTGAVALLVLPDAWFEAIVPVFIAVALVLVVAQPRLTGALAADPHAATRQAGPWGTAGIFGAGVYGGYFGAAQGILLLAVLGLSLRDDLQRINALKVVLAGMVNLVAGIVFALVADVAWDVAGVIAAGSIAGGYLGAALGRRLSAEALRAVVVVVGLVGHRPAGPLGLADDDVVAVRVGDARDPFTPRLVRRLLDDPHPRRAQALDRRIAVVGVHPQADARVRLPARGGVTGDAQVGRAELEAHVPGLAVRSGELVAHRRSEQVAVERQRGAEVARADDREDGGEHHGARSGRSG